MLWVDKYRPTSLQDLSYHSEITNRLTMLAKNPDMPHLIFYGPSGSGKKTRVNCLLKELYGNSATKLKLDKRTFTTPSKKTIEINLIVSNYHIELSPGDAGLNDRFVVQQVIKEMAANKNVMSIESTNKESSKKAAYKTVVLTEVDKLSRQAQAALRRTMEKYASTCRLILICNSPSKVIDPVRSRCLGIRVASPTEDQICEVLKQVGVKESKTVPDELAINIARESSRNLRRAILSLEACHVQNSNFTKDSVIQKTDWELYIAKLANDITREQTPQRLLVARDKLYELLVNCIPASVIIKTLAKELLKNLDDTLKQQVMEWAAFYEHRISLGSKEIFHLEAFVAKYMALYKRYLTEVFG